VFRNYDGKRIRADPTLGEERAAPQHFQSRPGKRKTCHSRAGPALQFAATGVNTTNRIAGTSAPPRPVKSRQGFRRLVGREIRGNVPSHKIPVPKYRPLKDPGKPPPHRQFEQLETIPPG